MAWINLLETIYPVGSVYISTLQTSPSSTIGGTWTQVIDAVVRGATSTGYGGSDTHTLTISEMPAHKHLLEYGSYVIAGGKSWQIPYAADAGVIGTHNPACYNTGGVGHSQSCRATTTAISGIGAHKHIKPSFGGDMIWHG